MINNEVNILPTVEDTPQKPRSQFTPSIPDTGRPVLHSSVFHDSPGESVSFAEKLKEIKSNFHFLFFQTIFFFVTFMKNNDEIYGKF